MYFFDVTDVFIVHGLITGKVGLGNISSYFLIPNKYLPTFMCFAEVCQNLKTPSPRLSRHSAYNVQFATSKYKGL